MVIIDPASYEGVEALPSNCALSCSLFDTEGAALHTSDISVFISFVCDLHISHIQILLQSKRGDVAKFRSVLRIPQRAFKSKRDLAFEPVENDEERPTDLGPDSFRLIVRFQLDQVSSEQLFIPDPPKQVSRIKDYLNSHAPLVIHVYGSPSSFLALYRQFVQDSSRDPLRKWLPPGSPVFLIRRNKFIPELSRPAKYIVQSKNSYFNYDEFLIQRCIGDLQEYESVAQKAISFEKETHSMWIFELLNGGDHAFLGLIEKLNSDALRLQPGETLLIANTEVEDEPTLEASVADPIPGFPASLIPIYLRNHYDQRTYTFGHATWPIDPIPCHEQSALVSNIARLRRQKHFQVEVHLVREDDGYDNKVTAMFELDEWFKEASERATDTRRVVIGSKFDDVRPYDIFAPILEQVPEPMSVMKPLNPGQKSAIEHIRAAPAGMALIQGPPGTGKTFVGGEVVRPFIAAKVPKVTVLACSAANKAVDALAIRLHSVIMSESNENAYLVRAYSTSTERDIALREGKSGAEKHRFRHAQVPSCVQHLDEIGRATFQSMQFAVAVQEQYAREHGPADGQVQDRRVTAECLKFSVGYRILQVLGEMPGGHGSPQANPGKFEDFHKFWLQLSKGEEIEDESFRGFANAIAGIRRHVLSNAAVVCSTITNAIRPQFANIIRENVKLAIIDEAARLQETEALGILAQYRSIAGYIQIGDICQLPPFVAARPDDGHFISQLGTSLMMRMQANGSPSAFLNVQHRMDPAIARPPNRMSYDGRLQDHESVLETSRPFAKEVRNFNQLKFGKACAAIVIDIEATETETSPSMSRYNVTYVKYGINLAKELVNRFPGKSISIFAYYGAQYRLYMSALERLVATDGKYDVIYVDKVDRIQGYECDFVIGDMPVAGRGGFLQNLSRPNVAMTRARYGYYLMLTKEHIYQSRSPVLQRLVQEYGSQGSLYVIDRVDQSWAPIESPYFADDMVDLEED
ncbi:hypothetical protein HRR83_007949 [Exophiala dermatitidis]|uniref:Uncharacterized protein n=2 Tax=Exophiala dermatitidis TaxID=5970 RepID=H6BUI9_EXODN|nr:uncharacterized protein HMPREF1120_03856 [Exophiala dermatitidis NIH/UT8656]KAJ4506539.1 hypothetical protein HRR75_006780 [Exophiala dermatitidis]EHY55731.1 hypothetical protein HMPREF1120_03856 [Exophiala dermatitidis NIH/UT8656]KAJ4508806.1 hypothetical protein HRR74_007397 [Exophiala dermatitidis]KAJ4510058.1 hypothetical protein HRR73_006855 [Exophiala dermatitidis]KAJ4539060.1 hypothetical protein HRR77_006476 [Exophiala dermatitidis]